MKLDFNVSHYDYMREETDKTKLLEMVKDEFENMDLGNSKITLCGEEFFISDLDEEMVDDNICTIIEDNFNEYNENEMDVVFFEENIASMVTYPIVFKGEHKYSRYYGGKTEELTFMFEEPKDLIEFLETERHRGSYAYLEKETEEDKWTLILPMEDLGGGYVTHMEAEEQ